MELIEVTDEQGNYYKYKKYNGRPFFPDVIGNVRDQLQMLENYDFKEDDVFLCTFPKSGTHWVFNIITMLRYGTMSYNGEHGLLEFHDKSKLDSLIHPRIIVTHLTYDILPSAIKRDVGKVVYVVRNPKDVFASYKYFNNALSSRYYNGNADGFLRKFLSGEFFGSGGSWFTYTKEWTDGITSNTALQVHTIMYEELKKDTYGEIEKLAKFLEIDYDDDEADHATEAGATDRWADICEDGRLPVYRKGIVGDWKNELTVSQNELFDAVIQEKCQDLTSISYINKVLSYTCLGICLIHTQLSLSKYFSMVAVQSRRCTYFHIVAFEI